jgi:hypothetical protein
MSLKLFGKLNLTENDKGDISPFSSKRIIMERWKDFSWKVYF